MSDPRVLIGVTPGMAGPSPEREFCRNTDVVYCDVNYLRRLEEAGGTPWLLSSNTDDELLNDVCSRLSGLLLTGGEDVEPSRYGQKNHGSFVMPNRDRFELRLLDLAWELRLPILAICRGFQIVNVAFGGTLIQDLPAQVGVVHHDQLQSTAEPSHEVELIDDCRLGSVFGTPFLWVNSHHHQAVDRIGRGLRVVGWSADGIAEALEAESYPYLIGVQWHPERLFNCLDEQRKLFSSFVQACREYRYGG